AAGAPAEAEARSTESRGDPALASEHVRPLPVGSPHVRRPECSATFANRIGSTFAPSEDSPVSSRVKAISPGRETRPRSSTRGVTTSRRWREVPGGTTPAAGTFLRNDEGRGKLRGDGGGGRGHGRPASRR